MTTKETQKIIRLVKYALACLVSGVVCTFLVTLLPRLFGVTLISTDVRNIVLLVILLTLVYFALATIIARLRKSRKVKIIILSLGMFLTTVLMVGGVYLANTILFFQSIDAGNDAKITYAVVVRQNSPYGRIVDLDGEKMGVMRGSEEQSAIDDLESSTDLSFPTVVIDSGVNELASALLEAKVEAICIEQGRLRFLNEELDGFEDDTRVIYTFKLHSESYKADQTASIDEPFIVYISGIDQYGQTNSIVGRSDVNQLVVVNPRTHKILLVNTPRDYYVQLAGTSGLKDKLTHAGIYGIETSLKTMEEMYGIKIDYYVRVNFDSLIRVVDQIDGIDIVSDQSFRALTDSDVVVQEGLNHFNGKQALAYARERYAYESGDRHRGENQQQVITAIINKMTGSSVLLKNYNNILQSLTGSFQTNIPKETIVDFCKDQIANEPEWSIEAISVDGSGSMQPTYSMGEGLPLYVMIPNEETLARAQAMIAEVMEEK